MLVIIRERIGKSLGPYSSDEEILLSVIRHSPLTLVVPTFTFLFLLRLSLPLGPYLPVPPWTEKSQGRLEDWRGYERYLP